MQLALSNRGLHNSRLLRAMSRLIGWREWARTTILPLSASVVRDMNIKSAIDALKCCVEI
jgi:hypothetical protein